MRNKYNLQDSDRVLVASPILHIPYFTERYYRYTVTSEGESEMEQEKSEDVKF